MVGHNTLASLFLLSLTSGTEDGLVNKDSINEYLFESQQFQLVDLSHNLDREFQKLTEPEKQLIRARYNNDEFLCSKSFWIGTSLDTTVKGPGNFLVNAHKISLKNLILPLIVADISGVVGEDGFVLYKKHLDYMINNYFGKIHQPCIVVFKFGWSKFKYYPRKYFGIDDLNNKSLNYPGISEEVAEWITKAYKNVVGVGVDLPSVDPGIQDYKAHNILVRAGVYVVENINLDQYLPDSSCTAFVGAIEHAATIGRTPLRFLAICPKYRMERSQTLLHRL